MEVKVVNKEDRFFDGFWTHLVDTVGPVFVVLYMEDKQDDPQEIMVPLPTGLSFGDAKELTDRIGRLHGKDKEAMLLLVTQSGNERLQLVIYNKRGRS